MKVKDMIEMLGKFNPEYDINISKHMVIVYNTDTTADEYFCVVDSPIAGVVENDETHELRFFTTAAEDYALKQIESNEWRVLEDEVKEAGDSPTHRR